MGLPKEYTDLLDAMLKALDGKAAAKKAYDEWYDNYHATRSEMSKDERRRHENMEAGLRMNILRCGEEAMKYGNQVTKLYKEDCRKAEKEEENGN